MAKIQSPYGLRPRRRLDGLPYAGHMRQLPIASGYNTDIRTGDLVVIGSNGTVERLSGTAVNQNVIGVFMGYQLEDNGGIPIVAQWNDWWEAGTVSDKAVAYIVDDPFVEFQIQASGSMDYTDLGKNFNIINPGTGRRLSDTNLNNSAVSGGAFKLIDFVKDAFSQPGDEYTDVIVKFNPGKHAYLSSDPRT